MIVLLVVGLTVATWRVTRLLVADEFPPTRALREWVLRTFGQIDAKGAITGSKRWGGLGHAIAYLWTCPWCMSPWVAAALIAVTEWRTNVPLPWLVGALGASFTGAMTMIEGACEQRWELRRLQIERETH